MGITITNRCKQISFFIYDYYDYDYYYYYYYKS